MKQITTAQLGAIRTEIGTAVSTINPKHNRLLAKTRAGTFTHHYLLMTKTEAGLVLPVVAQFIVRESVNLGTRKYSDYVSVYESTTLAIESETACYYCLKKRQQNLQRKGYL